MGQPDINITKELFPAASHSKLGLTEAMIQTPSGIRDLLIGIALIIPVGIAIGIVTAMGIVPPPWRNALLPLSGAVTVIVHMQLAQRRGQRQIQTIISAWGTSELGLLGVNIGRVITAYSVWYAAPTAAKSLIKLGRRDSTLRLRCTNAHVRIDPLSVEFEPLLIEEADSAFQALRSTVHHGPESSTHSDNQNQELKRKVLKSINLRGGKWVVFLFMFAFINSAFDAYSRGQVTWQLALWSFNVSMIFFTPIRGYFSTRQWLMVPGGLLLRTAGIFDTKSKLHLFDRRTSALVLVELRRRLWVAGIADDAHDSRMMLTESEADMLLRAWLSPLVPPKVERLTDFQ